MVQRQKLEAGIYRQRFRVVEGIVAPGDPTLGRGFDLVVGALEEPWEVEAALAYLAFMPKLVCIDWPDVLLVAAGGRGLARVLPGVFGVERALEGARDDLMARGFGGRVHPNPTGRARGLEELPARLA